MITCPIILLRHSLPSDKDKQGGGTTTRPLWHSCPSKPIIALLMLMFIMENKVWKFSLLNVCWVSFSYSKLLSDKNLLHLLFKKCTSLQILVSFCQIFAVTGHLLSRFLSRRIKNRLSSTEKCPSIKSSNYFIMLQSISKFFLKIVLTFYHRRYK